MFSEVEETYLDALVAPKKVPDEVRRAYAMFIVVERLPTVHADDVCGLAADIEAYLREAIAAEQAGMKVEAKPAELPVPEELKEKFRNDPPFKRAFEALTPGRQRGYLFHFASAKQSGTRTARIEKAMPAIFEGRGFLER